MCASDDVMQSHGILTGSNADIAIASLQTHWACRANNVIITIKQFQQDFEKASRDAIGSLDDSLERKYELGGVIEVEEKMGQMERALESMRASIARGNLQMKRKASHLEKDGKWK